MTNLDLRASPIIRFDCGDLAFAEPVDDELRIKAFEGRRIDTIACRDGTLVSPYRVTDAFRDIPGLRRFRVVQRALAAFDIEVEAEAGRRDSVLDGVKRVLADLLGGGLELNVAFRDRLTSDGARKFRPVECRLGRPAPQGAPS
jgi:phenylacetate-CoA ligase